MNRRTFTIPPRNPSQSIQNCRYDRRFPCEWAWGTFRPHGEIRQPHEECHEPSTSTSNFDHPDSLDTALLVQHIRELKEGKTVQVPTYDFTTHSRTQVTEEKEPRKILFIEGILIFTDRELVKEMDVKVFVVCLRMWANRICASRSVSTHSQTMLSAAGL